jgi:hypothetical protein
LDAGEGLQLRAHFVGYVRADFGQKFCRRARRFRGIGRWFFLRTTPTLRQVTEEK